MQKIMYFMNQLNQMLWLNFLLQTGKTPIHEAGLSGCSEIILLLIEAGADIEILDEVPCFLWISI